MIPKSGGWGQLSVKCKKMLRNLSEKLRAKFPSTTFGYSPERISHLDDAFAGILVLQASPVVGQQLKHKNKKKERGEKN